MIDCIETGKSARKLPGEVIQKIMDLTEKDKTKAFKKMRREKSKGRKLSIIS